MTTKLFYENPFLTTFSSEVLTCEAKGDTYVVSLEKTAFYPEGGGQPCDFGTLNGIAVTDVQEKEDIIYHTVAQEIPVGTKVQGEIDWPRRFDHMQQHSGEHIVSGIICEMFHCNNVGFHMGGDIVTIDYDAEISEEDLAVIETKANQYLYEDHQISIAFPSAEELKTIPYRSKKELFGQVRIVSFPGADCCACCGTHVNTSGQVGIVKLMSTQKFHGGSRLTLLCGHRALQYFSELVNQNAKISHLLSAKPMETATAVERMKNEVADLRLTLGQLEETAISNKAQELSGKGDLCLFIDHLSADSIRRYAIAIMETCGGRCAIFSGTEGAYQYAIGQKGGDLRSWGKEMNEALQGRGGGKPEFIQGSVASTKAAIESYFA